MGLDNPSHIAVIVVLLVLVFGARRLPEIGRSLGTGLREFKQSISGEHHDDEPPTLPPAAPPTQAPTQTTPTQDAFAQRDPAPTDKR